MSVRPGSAPGARCNGTTRMRRGVANATGGRTTVMNSEPLARGKAYPIADDSWGNVPATVRNQYKRGTLKARWTGERRPARRGEWFLSGGIIEAYYMPGEGSQRETYIAELVTVSHVEVLTKL